MVQGQILKVKEITPNYIEEAILKYQEYLAEKENKKEEKRELKAQAYAEKQAKKDDKDFAKIRDKLMTKIFANYQEDIIESQKTINEFSEKIQEHEQITNESLDKIKNAKGALGTEESAKHSKKMGKVNLWNMFGTSTSAAVSTLVKEGAVESSVMTGILQCLSPASAVGFMTGFFAPPIIGPLVSVGVTVLTGAASFIINKNFSKKANVGLTADSIEKMKSAVESWNETCKKLSQLNEMVMEDKESLIAMFRENKKKDFEKALDEYLFKTLAPKIKSLGLDFSLSDELKQEFLNIDLKEKDNQEENTAEGQNKTDDVDEKITSKNENQNSFDLEDHEESDKEEPVDEKLNEEELEEWLSQK